MRFCVDYRVLNRLTKKDAYPFAPVSECLDSLAGSKWFSTMDLNSGFCINVRFYMVSLSGIF